MLVTTNRLLQNSVKDNYLKALCDIGYKGFLTIEREVGEDVFGDISKAVNFLRSKINA